MAIHHPTPPLGGGERPRLPSAQVGPVTQAIRAMRAAEPIIPAQNNTGKPGISRFEEHGIRALSRTEVEDLIGGLIDLLDAMDGDTDLEVENEHGGDIQDEPHDPEEDMGAEEDKDSFGLLRFDGINYGRVRL
jgi:hypothetical protein